ncbi:MAG: IS110 family transposase [Polyangiaceae bacterium]|nr:IS110 family transposase [Polyangiaceae bacterium]
MKKRTYSTVDVEQFELLPILQLLTVGCIVAVDVAKTKFVAAIATAAGQAVRLVRFEHPRQTLLFLGLIEALCKEKLEPRVVMEPTGTYGDALRYQCHQRGVAVHMVSPKHTHDIAEVIDGVPSMHDPKAARALAFLAGMRPTKAWKPDSEAKRNVRALLDQRAPLAKTIALHHGHLEGMLARHWPELGLFIDVREQRSWMPFLLKYPGPCAVAANREAAAEILHNASRARLAPQRITKIVDSARTTVGVPMTEGEQARLRFSVVHIASETAELDAVDKKIAALVSKDEVMSRLAAVVGPVCAASIMGQIGSPRDFETPRALEKAMGLNLKERSSGKKKGQLSITKRGAPEVRQMLYLAALRLLQTNEIVEWWYLRRSSHSGRQPVKLKAVVAVMRKLARALWHVARGEDFDITKLFDVRQRNIKSLSNEDNAASRAEEQKKRLPFMHRSAPQEQPKKRSIAQQTA